MHGRRRRFNKEGMPIKLFFNRDPDDSQDGAGRREAGVRKKQQPASTATQQAGRSALRRSTSESDLSKRQVADADPDDHMPDLNPLSPENFPPLIPESQEDLSSMQERSDKSPSSSPLKQRPRWSETEQTLHVNPQEEDSEQPQGDMLEQLPATSKYLTEASMRHMLITLRKSFQADIQDVLHPIKAIVEDLGNRVDHLETKMGEFATSHNQLIDSHTTVEEELQRLNAKIADLEDRSRRNNVKIRGIPESVPPKDVLPYVTKMLKTILPGCSDQELEIDRAHRIPKPKHLDDSIPRDVLARVHFFNTKEKLMEVSRKQGGLPAPYQKITLFADLSAATLQLRRALFPVTATLRNNNIQYRWGFPVRLLVNYNNKIHVIKSMEDGSALLQSWNIKMVSPPHSPATQDNAGVV